MLIVLEKTLLKSEEILKVIARCMNFWANKLPPESRKPTAWSSWEIHESTKSIALIDLGLSLHKILYRCIKEIKIGRFN